MGGSQACNILSTCSRTKRLFDLFLQHFCIFEIIQFEFEIIPFLTLFSHGRVCPLPSPPSGKLRVHSALSKQPTLVHWSCCNKKYPRPVSYKQQKLTPHSSGGRRPKVRAPAPACSGERPLPASHPAPSGRVRKWLARVTELPGASFLRALVPLVPRPPNSPTPPHTPHPVRLCPLGLINHRSRAPLRDFRQ